MDGEGTFSSVRGPIVSSVDRNGHKDGMQMRRSVRLDVRGGWWVYIRRHRTSDRRPDDNFRARFKFFFILNTHVTRTHLLLVLYSEWL